MNTRSKLALALLFWGSLSVEAAAINQIDYATLTGTQIITFDDVSGGVAPGTNYDGIFESGNTAFGERFAGQVLSNVGGFDSLAGSPTAPLTLLVGAANQNLNIFLQSTQVLTGLGPAGFPDFDAIGEGSFALLFDFDQSEFGFQLVGGDGGSATVDFFQRDGTLIQRIILTSLSSTFYGFQREGSVQDIAGISIFNSDAAGIGFDNLKHDVAGIPDTGRVPEPASFAMGALGLAAVAWLRSRRRA